MCFSAHQLVHIYSPCVDQGVCSENLYTEMICQMEYQNQVQSTGDFTLPNQCSQAKMMNMECASYVSDVGCQYDSDMNCAPAGILSESQV